MEYLKITTGKRRKGFPKMKVLDFTPMRDYWKGALVIMPSTIKTIELGDYKNNKCLSWYDKQVEHHDKVMAEFKRIFSWRKK